MATYSIDPVTVDIGDFTHRHGGTAIIQVVDDAGTPSILFDPNNVDTFYSYDLIPPIADLEILTLVRNSRTGNSGNGALAVARMGETGFSLYGSGLRNAADTTIISYVSGSVAGLSNVTRSIDTTAYTWQRFRLTGNTLEQKTWQGAPEDEPAAYQAIITNTDVTASGLVGVGMRGASTILDQSYYAWLSVGTDGDAAPFPSTGPSITTADDIATEGQSATFTLSGNTAAPVSATLNGEPVGTLTAQGSGVYSYTAPLIADDDTADLVVSVDGTTASATIAYANSYDRDQLTHPATEAEYSENSLSYPNAYATTQPYEWKVIADANASVVTINWNALEADDGFHKNVASYATPVANGSTTVTLGVFVPETGQAYQFDRTITVSDGSVVVTGEGLFRSLFSALEKSLFKPLFR